MQAAPALTPAQELAKFAAAVATVTEEMKAALDASKFHMQHRAALAAKYNVPQHLFGGDSFLRECARKEVCRRMKANA